MIIPLPYRTLKRHCSSVGKNQPGTNFHSDMFFQMPYKFTDIALKSKWGYTLVIWSTLPHLQINVLRLPDPSLIPARVTNMFLHKYICINHLSLLF